MKYYLIRYRFSLSGEEINYSSRGSGVSESSLGGRHHVPKTCLYTRCTGSRCRRNILIKKYHSSFPRTKKPPEVSPDWQRTASSSSSSPPPPRQNHDATTTLPYLPYSNSCQQQNKAASFDSSSHYNYFTYHTSHKPPR